MQSISSLKPRAIRMPSAVGAQESYSAAQALRAQKTIAMVMGHASNQILVATKDMTPEEVQAFAQRAATAIHTFIMIGGKDAETLAPKAFLDALEAKGADITDLDIAAMAYGNCSGSNFAITRDPRGAREQARALEAQGKTVKRWNKGAYTLIFVVPTAA